MLKNDDVLPISKYTKFALFGTGQIETIRGGTGSGETHPMYTVNFLDGVLERGLNVDSELVKFYREKIEEFRNGDYKVTKGSWGEEIKPKLPENFIKESQLEEIAKRNEVAIVVITRISGEGYDRKAEKGDYYLSDDEFELLKSVSKMFRKYNKKVVVALNIGSPIEVESWKNLCDGILLVWQPGQEAGRILADVLTGDVNPSGKLPTTFPKDYNDVPSRSFPGEPRDNPTVVVYDEGIYVGYRYYDTFRVEPAYEFGFGLSYTTFEYSNLSIKRVGAKIVVEFDVRNTGNRPGKEIAQLYVRAPIVKIDKPYQELKAFEKTKILEPGEVQHFTIELSASDLASFDGNSWIVEEGEYEFRIGASSRDIRLVGKIKI